MGVLTLRAAHTLSLILRNKGKSEVTEGKKSLPTSAIESRAYPQIGTSLDTYSANIRSLARQFYKQEFDEVEVAMLAALLIINPNLAGLSQNGNVSTMRKFLLKTLQVYSNKRRSTKHRQGTADDFEETIDDILPRIEAISFENVELFIHTHRERVKDIFQYLKELFSASDEEEEAEEDIGSGVSS